MTRRTLLRLAALFSLLAPLPAPAQTAARLPVAAQAAGYHWRTLVLRHAVPSDILALMHWDHSATPPDPAPFQALPPGVLRVFALRSNNSLLVQATDDGFATVAKLVKVLDSAPRRVQFRMSLVVAPKMSARLYTPDMAASELLPLLLAGGARVASAPTQTITDGQTASLSIAYDPLPPPARFRTLPPDTFRLTQAGSEPTGRSARSHCDVLLTPRMNADGTISLGLALANAAPPMQVIAPRTLRAGETVVYEVTGRAQPDGARLFLFLQPAVIGESDETTVSSGIPSVIVTP